MWQQWAWEGILPHLVLGETLLGLRVSSWVAGSMRILIVTNQILMMVFSCLAHSWISIPSIHKTIDSTNGSQRGASPQSSTWIAHSANWIVVGVYLYLLCMVQIWGDKRSEMALTSFRSNIDWYQSKIGDHDKQYWEQSVEGKMLNSIDSLPKRDVNHTEQNRELLDIDLLKGSTFTKAAPSHTSYMRTWIGLVKILFLPFYFKWWIKHTTWRFFAGILLLYASQIFVTSVYFYLPKTSSSTSAVLLFEVTNPLLFMFVLSVIHTQIVYTQASARSHPIFKKTSTTSAAATVSSTGKRTGTVKRSKKSKPTKRKVKAQSSSENIGKVSLSIDVEMK